jgi:hypothetical protein
MMASANQQSDHDSEAFYYHKILAAKSAGSHHQKGIEYLWNTGTLRCQKQ